MNRNGSFIKRTLIVLKMLYKETDEKHALNTVRANKTLAAYDLQYRRDGLNRIIHHLRDLGTDVHSGNDWDSVGLWLNDRAFAGENFYKVLFAVCSNPFLSDEMVDDILADLKKVVTIYQEPELMRSIVVNKRKEVSALVFHNFVVIHQAIQQKRRIKFDTGSNGSPVICSPGRIYTKNKEFYLFGYDYATEETFSVNLKEITSIQFRRRLSPSSVSYARCEAKLHAELS